MAFSRKALLEQTKVIQGVRVVKESGWMGCLEITIATIHGIATVSVQNGQNGESEGPFFIPSDLHAMGLEVIRKRGSSDGSAQAAWEAMGTGISFKHLLDMIRFGAQPDIRYYRLRGDDPVFGTDPDTMRQEFIESLMEIADEWEAWKDMDREDLERHMGDLGLFPNSRKAIR